MSITTERIPRLRVRHAVAVAGTLGLCAAFAACKDNNSPATLTPNSVMAQGADTLTGVVGTALGTQVAVRVLDVSLRPVPNVTVTFTVSPANGATLSPTTATTNDSGVASTTATLGDAAGTDTVFAAVASIPSGTVFLFANGGPPTQVMADSGNQQSATAGTALPDSLIALVTDQYGNPLPNVTVTWSTTSSGALGAATTQTNAAGLTANTYTLAPSAGAQSVVAQISTSVLATFTETGQ